MIRYIKKNKILFCFTLIINLLTCLTPLFLAYIIENVSGIFLNQDESINDNLNMYINDRLRMYTSDYTLI